MMMAEPNLQTRDNSALLRLQQTHRCLLSRLYISTKPKEKKSSVKMFFRRSHILWILIICEAVSGDYVTKAVNSETAFTPVSGSIAPSTTSIIWKHRNNAGIVVKVIEWDRDDGSFDIPNANFKSHARLDKDTGELTLRNLQLKHTGVYTIDINSKEQRKQFSLTVKEPVNKPRITKECILGDVPECNLSCDGGDGPPETTITWKNSDGEMPNRQNMRMIIVTKSSNPENFYTCTLKNAVSEKTSDPVYERDLFDDSNTKFVLAIVTSSIIMFLIVITLITWLCCFKLRILKRHSWVND